MSDKAFIDTNVFVYLYSEDEPEKQICANNAIAKYDCITSTQTLNEFSNVCLKKLCMPVEVINQSIDEIVATCEVALVDHGVIKKALELHRRYGYSYYDCLILASALSCNCRYLLTEDLTDRQIIEDKLTIINIFPR